MGISGRYIGDRGESIGASYGGKFEAPPTGNAVLNRRY